MSTSTEEYLEGIRFGFHVTSLYSARSLRFVASHLHHTGMMPFADFFTAFRRYSQANSGSLYNHYIEGIIARNNQGGHSVLGGLLHFVLHLARQEFDKTLFEFMRSLQWWDDERVRFLFELDLLNRPYVYLNTRIAVPRHLSLVSILGEDAGGFRVLVPPSYYAEACRLLMLDQEDGVARPLSVQYRTTQYPYMKGKDFEQNFLYCNEKLHKMNSVLPVWKTESVARTTAERVSLSV